MNPDTDTVIRIVAFAALALLAVLAVWVKRKTSAPLEPPDDDMGATPRDLELVPVRNDDRVLVAVRDLVPGMHVDLEGDKYADPNSDNTLLEYEYQVVEAFERETPGCICVYFDGITCGFPPDHRVKVLIEESAPAPEPRAPWVAYSPAHMGWCVYHDDNDLVGTMKAGPFETREEALAWKEQP